MHAPALDEREVMVERDGDRLAWLVTAFGLLAIVAWRSFVDGVASWELLVLVVLGGVVSFGYRLWHRSMSRASLIAIGATLAVAVVVAIVIAALGNAR